MKSEEIKQITNSLQNEINGAALYQGIAAAEKDPKIAEVYRRMAASEQRHAELLTGRLEAADVPVPTLGITWRTNTLVWLAKRFGVGIVLPSVAAFEQNDQLGYSHVAENAQLAADEASHARLLRQISGSTAGGMEGSALAQIEGRHRSAGGNALRAAVLGANDGLVSNLSLVMGVAGAKLSSQSILITGFAGLLAGAFSMALGEWLSVQSSRELYQHQIAIEKDEIASIPEEEVEELSLIYQSRGIQAEQADHLAGQIMADQGSALGLFIIGGGITLFTGRSVPFSGGRQVGFGLAAAAATYLIGRWIGVSIGG